MTLEELQARREEVLAGSGLLSVRFSDGREMSYSDPVRALQVLDAEIAKVQAGSSDSRVFVVQTSRGLE